MPTTAAVRRAARQALIAALVARVGSDVVGDRVHRIRTGMGLSIRDVASRAGISKTSLVRLEQGLGSRPATLAAVCDVLGLHLERLEEGVAASVGAVHHVGDDRWFDMTDVAAGPLDAVVRAGTSRPKPSTRVAVAVDLLRSRLADGRVLPTILEVFRESVPRSHPGEEFVYVLSGRLRLTVGKQEFELAPGESICFWSGEPHKYAPIGREAARILSVRVDG